MSRILDTDFSSQNLKSYFRQRNTCATPRNFRYIHLLCQNHMQGSSYDLHLTHGMAVYLASSSPIDKQAVRAHVSVPKFMDHVIGPGTCRSAESVIHPIKGHVYVQQVMINLRQLR
jgi:hypothetical protein